MNEPNALNDVAKFHRLFDLPVVDKPQIPDEKRCKLRVNLLEEELEELKRAIEHNDLVEIADALCDLQYVLSGAVLEFGLGEKFKALFEEVQRSNMSKASQSLKEAKATQKLYERLENVQSTITETQDGHFLVHRTTDGKVLKSVNYLPAELNSILKQEK